MEIKMIEFQRYNDERGSMTVIEEGKQIPFSVKRVYYMHGFSSDSRRGFHAHKRISQIAIPLQGSCDFLLDNGTERIEVKISDKNKGLLLEPNTWREIYNFSDDCLLMLLASELYDESEYIRDYNDFLSSLSRTV